MRPLIGITSSPAVRRSRVLGVDRSLTTLDRAYVEAVTAAGGVAVVLPVQDRTNAASVAQVLDGLLLSGGGDVAPERYGAERHPEVGGVDEERDDWEVALIAQASHRALPMLAVCRGLQILNVAYGGTLVQHLEHADGPHLVPGSYDEPTHVVRLTADSRVAGAIGAESVDVNTLHHQAIEHCASELVAVGWDDDGVIEAVEHRDASVLGVQWHPEMLTHLEPHRRLFDWLVDRARGSDDADADTEPDTDGSAVA